jgi:soluble lytic murein transglycosylase-like protein
MIACMATVAALVPQGVDSRIPEAVCKASEDHSIPPEVLLALISTESDFRVGARSVVGAQGLAQVMPRTGAELAEQHGIALAADDLLDPHINVWLGAAYLRKMLTRFNNSWHAALTAYNRGPLGVGKSTTSFYSRQVLTRAAGYYLHRGAK